MEPTQMQKMEDGGHHDKRIAKIHRKQRIGKNDTKKKRSKQKKRDTNLGQCLMLLRQLQIQTHDLLCPSLHQHLHQNRSHETIPSCHDTVLRWKTLVSKGPITDGTLDFLPRRSTLLRSTEFQDRRCLPECQFTFVSPVEFIRPEDFVPPSEGGGEVRIEGLVMEVMEGCPTIPWDEMEGTERNGIAWRGWKRKKNDGRMNEFTERETIAESNNQSTNPSIHS